MTADPGPITLVTSKSQDDRAAELKQKINEAAKPLLAIMDEATREGFLVRWQTIACNAFGRNEIVDLHLIKRF